MGEKGQFFSEWVKFKPLLRLPFVSYLKNQIVVDIEPQGNTFVFEITSSTGSVLLSSASFSKKEEAEAALLQIKQFRNKKIVKFERRTDHDGRFFFQIKNTSGKILGRSQTYDSEPGMQNGIKNLKSRLSTMNMAP